jgi:hypothetical protein
VCVSRAWLSAPAVGTSQGPFNQHRKKSWVQSLFGEYSMSIIHFSSGMIGASTHAAQHATSPKRQILPRQVEARTRCTSPHTNYLLRCLARFTAVKPTVKPTVPATAMLPVHPGTVIPSVSVISHLTGPVVYACITNRFRVAGHKR